MQSPKVMYMTTGGKILAEIMDSMLKAVREGVTGKEIDVLAKKLCKQKNVKPGFLGYNGFPAAVCITINNEVVHGIPDDRKFRNGDIITLDMGIIYKGYYLDMARTIGLGKIDKVHQELINTSKKAFNQALSICKDGVRVGDIGATIQNIVESHGFSVVRQMVGHSIGKNLHEEPLIPGYGVFGTGQVLHTGHTLAIEVIINEGSFDIVLDEKDGWVYKTLDGSISVTHENTLVVEQKGGRILTKL